MNNQLFRKEALVRIESPERLNEMVKITSARSWLILTAIIGVLTAFILWSIFGELPYTINGQGILLQPGGIIEIASIASGRIERTMVLEADIINEGDVIAYIDQPELEMQIENAKKELADINKRFMRISDFGYENLELKKKLYEKEEFFLNKTIKLNFDRLNFIKERIAAQEELLAKGLITKENLNNTKDEFFNIQQKNDKLSNDLKELQRKMYEIKEQNEIELNQIKSEILNIENRIRELEALHQLNSKVISPYTGKIIELMVNPGKVVEAGSSIVSIEPLNLINDLQAIIYVNPKEGKKIEPNMKVKLSPSTIEVEEFGYIIGIVEKVSEYPSTFQGMLRTLGNIELIKTFTQEGPPIAIKVYLDKDSTTFSGYSWTSKHGPELEIKSGTLCSSKIVTKTRSPISLLFPKLSNRTSKYFNEKFETIETKSKKESYVINQEYNAGKNNGLLIDTLSEKDDIPGFTIQIAATRRSLNLYELSTIYNGEEIINEEYIDDWYKYSIGNFRSKDEAKSYIKENNLGTRVFIRTITNVK